MCSTASLMGYWMMTRVPPSNRRIYIRVFHWNTRIPLYYRGKHEQRGTGASEDPEL